ncbi:MAG: hypothetical protein H6729_00185 [Deltaproteobacteria bacterium]|nr:hypothetical protein [Deltaproteobacteria bacterium]
MTSSITANQMKGGLKVEGATSLDLPANVEVSGDLRFINCSGLRVLPPGLHVRGNLVIRGCARFQGLGNDTRVDGDLLIVGRTSINVLPRVLKVGGTAIFKHSVSSLKGLDQTEGGLAIIACPIATLPTNLAVGGDLLLRNVPRLRSLPQGLAVRRDIYLHGEGPALTGLSSVHGRLIVRQHPLNQLPEGLQVLGDLVLAELPNLTWLPRNTKVAGFFIGRNLTIQSLPPSLKVGRGTDLRHCSELEVVAEGFEAGDFLYLVDAPKLHLLPASMPPLGEPTDPLQAIGSPGRAMGAPADYRAALDLLGDRCGRLPALDVSGCSSLRRLPLVRGSGAIEIAGAALTEAPDIDDRMHFTWDGVTVPKDFLFGDALPPIVDVLNHRSAEVRRVTMLRLEESGMLAQSDFDTLDEDEDAGGRRRLLRFNDPQGKEPMVVLCCQCPSTARRYYLRVHPRVRSCQEAAAWMAGYDEPKRYRPEFET